MKACAFPRWSIIFQQTLVSDLVNEIAYAGKEKSLLRVCVCFMVEKQRKKMLFRYLVHPNNIWGCTVMY